MKATYRAILPTTMASAGLVPATAAAVAVAAGR